MGQNCNNKPNLRNHYFNITYDIDLKYINFNYINKYI